MELYREYDLSITFPDLCRLFYSLFGFLISVGD
jgi:hypothetical protein